MSAKSRILGIIAVVAILLLVAGGYVWLHRASAPSAIIPPPKIHKGHRADWTHLPLVYQSDFAHTPGDAWSSQQIDESPNGQLFLGKCGNETVSLSIAQLPPHALLKVSFDLYIIGSWDGINRGSGSRGPLGPDFFIVDLHDGPNLLRTTFSGLPSKAGLGYAPDGMLQNFPSPIPTVPNPSYTGAAATNSLGFIMNFGGGDTVPMDAVYPISFTLPNTDEDVSFDFTGAGLQEMIDESWGIANVKVEALPAAAPPSEASLTENWNLLLGSDPVAAHDAFWKLVAAGDATVAMLDKTAGGFGLHRETLKAMMQAYHEDTSNAGALSQLIAAGPAAEPMMRELARTNPDLSWPCEKALREIELHALGSPIAVRTAATARLLYVINTPAARALATKLSSQPLPVISPDSPLYAADWRTRFDAAYKIAPGHVATYIPPPLPPERDLFWRAWRQEQDRRHHGQIYQGGLPITSPIAIYTADQPSLDSYINIPNHTFHFEGKSLPDKGLSRLLIILNAQGRRYYPKVSRVIVPPALESIDLPGDWTILQGAPQDKMLAELARIVEEQTHRRIVFTPQTIQEEAIVVRGKYAFYSEDPEATRPVIQFYADTKDDATEKPYVQTDPLSMLLHLVGEFAGIQVIDESEGAPPKVSWHMHNSVVPPLNQPKVDQMLSHLTEQTSLTFTREIRPAKVFNASEATDPEK